MGSHQYFVPTNDGDSFFSIIGFGEEDDYCKTGQQDGATCKSCKMADLFRKKNVPQGKKKNIKKKVKSKKSKNLYELIDCHPLDIVNRGITSVYID